jgi:citrate/tricarballylate utilization protein
MPATKALAEAERLMTICNSCRYCEGLCAVFPAMEMRRAFSDGDLHYLANLCHDCGACYYDCQFSPPHEFDVNVPKTFAQVRAESYRAYAWPRAFAGMFARNGLAVGIVAALSVAVFILGILTFNDPSALTRAADVSRTFYSLMPHAAMAMLFGAAFLYALTALAMGVRAFWRDIGEPVETLGEPRALWQAALDAGQLRYLDGGGAGCMNSDERPAERRRIFHHLTFYGFALCFAATCVATLYHFVLGQEAPYPWYDLPVLLGAAGGVGLLIGPVGLLAAKWQRDAAMRDRGGTGMDLAFLAMLFATSLSGMALLFFRGDAAMGFLLAFHLGVVFGLFVTMPYGKFVHGVFRFAALVRYAKERASISAGQGLDDA